MDRELAAIIEGCLQRLDRGEDLPAVLTDFPEQEGRIKPVLLVAMASRAFPVPVPCQTAQRLGRNQMLAEMNQRETRKSFRREPSVPLKSRWIGKVAGSLRTLGFNKLAYSYRLAMVSLVLVLTGGFLTINASASSQPGDFLYTLKQSLGRAGLVWVIQSEDLSEQSGNLALPGRRADELPGSERSLLVLVGVNQMLTEEDKSSRPPAFANFSDDEGEDDLNAGEKDLKQIEKEEEKDQKEIEKEEAKQAKEIEKDLKEEEKAAAAEEKDAEKEAEKNLKDKEKEAAAEEKDAEKDQKEQEKDLAAEEKEAEKEVEKDLKEQKKEEDKEPKPVAPQPTQKDNKPEKEVEKLEKITEKEKSPNDKNK